ncbi:hypothetical protein [Piscirickettsia salmonis]|uniref:hypothetical protein n=1 Tax=Piscirickettsia salmonis TaxID=1238 RepID=UPI003EC0FF53
MLGDFASLDVQNTYRGSDAYEQLIDKQHIACVVSSEEVEENYAKHSELFEPVQQLSRCELRRLNNASSDYCGVVDDDDTAVLESSCGYGDDGFNLEPVLKTADLGRLKKELQNTNTSAEKQAVFAKCQNLRALCFAVSIRQKSGLFYPKNTTATGNELICLLNRPEYDELRRKICPDGAKVRMRDIRSYARCGVRSVSGYCFNEQDSKNEAFFSYLNNPHFKVKEPMLLFSDYFNDSKDHAAEFGSAF